MDNKQIINRDFIGVIEEENGLLKYKKIEIPYPRELVKEIDTLGNDNNCTIMDVQELFLKYYPKDRIKDKSYDYLLPKDYDSAFNVWARSPKFYKAEDYPYKRIYVGGLISYSGKECMFYPSGFNSIANYNSFLNLFKEKLYKKNLRIVLENLIYKYGKSKDDKYKKEIEELKKLKESDFQYVINVEELRKTFYNAVTKETEKDFVESINNFRLFFAKGVVRYIYALNYTTVKEKLPKSILMFSTENQGWTTYKYQIASNERIELHSNFGYGGRSYFYCNLFYKEIPVLPYADAVKYVSVDWQQVVNYTRRYVPQREVCWDETFTFVVEVSNLIKQDPQKFIDEFIVGEIRGMLSELRKLLRYSPRELKDYFDNQSLEDRKTTFVRNTGLDRESYEIFPEEVGDSEKIEKISGCLYFLDNMRKLNEFIPAIKLFIDELIALNNQISPLIDTYLLKLPMEIQQNTAELDELSGTINAVKSQMEKCKEENAPDLVEVLNLKRDAQPIDDFFENHPHIVDVYQEYLELEKRSWELNLLFEKKSKLLRLRKNFLKRFEECKSRVETLIQ